MILKLQFVANEYCDGFHLDIGGENTIFSGRCVADILPAVVGLKLQTTSKSELCNVLALNIEPYNNRIPFFHKHKNFKSDLKLYIFICKSVFF